MFCEPIGWIRSDFKEKFGVPRQSLMVPNARAILKLKPDPHFRSALAHLDSFSHIWVIFEFHHHLHKTAGQAWTPTIRPPRLDAPNRVGVFASRSPDRPNPIGMSAVKLDRIDFEAENGIELHLSGVDLLHETPVLDIKPYLPYADLIPHATSGWAQGEIKKYPVDLAPELMNATAQEQIELAKQMLQWDPRPLSQRESMPVEDPEQEGKTFAFRFANVDVHWKIKNGGMEITKIVNLSKTASTQA